jgi:hypothetical protein
VLFHSVLLAVKVQNSCTATLFESKCEFKTYFVITICSHLGGVVVNVLATRPKGHVFKPCQGNGILRAIKVRSTPSFE